MGEKRERIIGVERGGEEREEECLERVQGGGEESAGRLLGLFSFESLFASHEKSKNKIIY